MLTFRAKMLRVAWQEHINCCLKMKAFVLLEQSTKTKAISLFQN